MFPNSDLSFINNPAPLKGFTEMAHASEDPLVVDAGGNSVEPRPVAGRKIGKKSMYLNHRAIIDGATIAKPSAAVTGAVSWPVEQPSFVAGFKPWQLATIAVLATAAWAAPIGLLVAYLG
jgi:hypothetical protein